MKRMRRIALTLVTIRRGFKVVIGREISQQTNLLVGGSPLRRVEGRRAIRSPNDVMRSSLRGRFARVLANGTATDRPSGNGCCPGLCGDVGWTVWSTLWWSCQVRWRRGNAEWAVKKAVRLASMKRGRAAATGRTGKWPTSNRRPNSNRLEMSVGRCLCCYQQTTCPATLSNGANCRPTFYSRCWTAGQHLTKTARGRAGWEISILSRHLKTKKRKQVFHFISEFH